MKKKPTDVDLANTVAALAKERDELAAMLDILKTIPTAQSFEQSARTIFDCCKALTHATCGYVALLNEGGNENEVLFLDDGGLTCSVDPSLPMPIRGLRALAYKNGRVAHDNQFNNSKWIKFMPPGHVELENVMFSPLVFGKQTVGVIGLANKPGGFDDHDIGIARAFGEIAALALKHSRIQEDLMEREKFSKNLLMRSPNPILVINADKSIRYANRAFEELSGFSTSEILDMKPPYPWWTPDTIERTQSDFRKALRKGANRVEEKFQKKDGEIFYVTITSIPVMEKGTLSYYLANWVDVTEKKRKELELLNKKRDLETHSKKLEDMNTALNVLLEHRDNEKERFQNDLLKSFEKLIFPYFLSTKKGKSAEEIKTTLSIIERNIKEILLKNKHPKSSIFSALTPTEARVAEMVKDGKRSKEIASALYISARTVYFHRENIRKKLDLSKTKNSLKTYLQAAI